RRRRRHAGRPYLSRSCKRWCTGASRRLGVVESCVVAERSVHSLLGHSARSQCVGESRDTGGQTLSCSPAGRRSTRRQLSLFAEWKAGGREARRISSTELLAVRPRERSASAIDESRTGRPRTPFRYLARRKTDHLRAGASAFRHRADRIEQSLTWPTHPTFS